MVGWLWRANCKRCGIKRLWPTLKYYTRICLKRLGKIMTTTARLTEGVGTAGTSLTRIWEAPRTVLEPTQPPIRWVPWALSVRVKRPGREADHSPPSNAEVKECMEWYLHSPTTPSWRDVRLKKAQARLYIYLLPGLNTDRGQVMVIEAFLNPAGEFRVVPQHTTNASYSHSFPSSLFAIIPV
jgi:hypothetical protein